MYRNNVAFRLDASVDESFLPDSVGNLSVFLFSGAESGGENYDGVIALESAVDFIERVAVLASVLVDWEKHSVERFDGHKEVVDKEFDVAAGVSGYYADKGHSVESAERMIGNKNNP